MRSRFVVGAALVSASMATGACAFSPPAAGDRVDARSDDSLDGPVESDAAEPAGRVIDDSLLGVWRFDDAMGPLVRDTVRTFRPGYAESPMDLAIESIAGWRWIAGGLQLDGAVQIRTPPGTASRPHMTRAISGTTAVPGSHALTLELWVTPASDAQGVTSYATIFSMSPNPTYCNLRIVQSGSRYLASVRTAVDTRGPDMPVGTPGGTARAGVPTHLVLVSDGATRRLYVDGVAHDSPPPGVSAPANWTDYYRITVGNENDATLYPRPWSGQLWFAAVYDRALTQEEVRQNLTAGHDCADC